MELSLLISKYAGREPWLQAGLRMKACGIWQCWETALGVFAESIQEGMTAQNESCLRGLAESCLLPLLQHVNAGENSLPTADECHAVALAAAALMQYAMQETRLPAARFTPLFLQIMLKPREEAYESLMLGELINCLKATGLLQAEPILYGEKPLALPAKNFRLRWNHLQGDRGDQLPFFADALCKQFPGVRTPRNIIELCTHAKDSSRITLPHRHLCPVLALFELMLLGGRMSREGNHGLMLFMSRHIVAPEKEEKYNPTQFRIKKFRALNDAGHKMCIKQQVKDIFFRFCPGDKAEKVFEKYFS